LSVFERDLLIGEVGVAALRGVGEVGPQMKGAEDFHLERFETRELQLQGGGLHHEQPGDGMGLVVGRHKEVCLFHQ
jgi:hypothetical protein